MDEYTAASLVQSRHDDLRREAERDSLARSARNATDLRPPVGRLGSVPPRPTMWPQRHFLTVPALMLVFCVGTSAAPRRAESSGSSSQKIDLNSATSKNGGGL